MRVHRVGWGDVDAEPADLVIENSYSFPMVTHFAIEPHAFMAAPDGDGIAVWTTIQHPYWLQRILAGILGLPLSRVRVIAPDPGGGFGGKQQIKYEPVVAFMALRAGRPVRLVLTLEETFQAVRRAAAEVRVRTGVRSDGTLAFQDIKADYLMGAYVDIADRVVEQGQLRRGRAVPHAGRQDRGPRHPLPHGSVHRVPRLRQPPGQLGRRVEPGRGRPRARHRSPRVPPAQPGPQGRSLHPVGHARPTATGSRPSAGPAN